MIDTKKVYFYEFQTIDPVRILNIAMEHDPFVDDLPTKNVGFPSMAMCNPMICRRRNQTFSLFAAYLPVLCGLAGFPPRCASTCFVAVLALACL